MKYEQHLAEALTFADWLFIAAIIVVAAVLVGTVLQGIIGEYQYRKLMKSLNIKETQKDK